MVEILPRSSSSGQALIILLLVMVVGLTIGLSIATRTATDVRLTSQDELSQKAFSAAEAGIEDALRRDLGTFSSSGTQTVGDAQYEVRVTPQGGGQTFATSEPIVKDDVAQVILNPPTANPPTTMDIYWVNTAAGSGETSPEASLEIIEVYENGGTYGVYKYTFNSNCTTTSASGDLNNFMTSGCDPAPATATIGGRTYSAKVSINLKPAASDNPQYLRIKPLYNKTSVAVQGPAGTTLPLQGYLVESTGISSDISRKIQVFRSAETLPSIFDYVLYSGSDLLK